MYRTKSISPSAPAIEETANARTKWRRSALLLIGHGSRRGDPASDPIHSHAEVLRRRRCFAEVSAVTLMETAEPRSALDTLRAARVYIVPFLMGDGVYARSLIPQALGLEGATTLRRDAFGQIQQLCHCRPVGTSAQLAQAVETQLLEACAEKRWPSAAVTVVLVGHGSSRGSGSSGMENLADAVSATRRFAEIVAVNLERPPSLEQFLDRGTRGPTVVAAMLAAAGKHGAADIPAIIARSLSRSAGRPDEFHYAGVIGNSPTMVSAILDRVAAFDDGRAGSSEILVSAP